MVRYGFHYRKAKGIVRGAPSSYSHQVYKEFPNSPCYTERGSSEKTEDIVRQTQTKKCEAIAGIIAGS
jgi:hypothetical protein